MVPAVGRLPDLSPDLGGLTAAAVYGVVLGFVFVESGLLVGFLLPGDTHPVRCRPGVRRARVGGLPAGAGRRRVRRRRRRRLGRLRPRLPARPRLAGRGGWTAAGSTSGTCSAPSSSTPGGAGGRSWSRAGSRGSARSPRSSRAPAGCRTRGSCPPTSSGALCWAVGLTVLGHLAAGTPALRHVSYAVAAALRGRLARRGCRRLVARPGGTQAVASRAWVDTRCPAPGPPNRTGGSGSASPWRPSLSCWSAATS